MLEIEIVETNIIDGGIEVFARAWRNGLQIGLGADGTVDIERFRFINPPVLVKDPNGNIERVYEFVTESGTETVSSFYREDPEEALLQSLSHSIEIVGLSGDNIIAGKIGNTTDTFYSSTDDGTIIRQTEATWAGARDGATGTVGQTNPEYAMGEYIVGSLYRVARFYVSFNTGPTIPDGSSISSATLSLYGFNAQGDGFSDSIHAVKSTLASAPSLATGDFDGVTFSSLASATIASIGSSAYTDFALSSTSGISDTGYSNYAFITGLDLNNTTPSPQGTRNYKYFYTFDETGSAQDPKLVVVHTSGGGSPTPLMMLMGMGS